jgi:molecular chaperone HtpG
MKRGNINVQTENIFPIIKKFLYSDHEIFLRELVSNAVDACQKLKALISLGEAKGEFPEGKVEVLLNAEAKTLTIRDNGLGMDAEDIEKYITQIAFSGAEEFVNRYKDKTPEANAIIGHFGLGFYSSFMVASKVEILSRSYKPGSVPAHWSCDGTPAYELIEGTKEQVGTDVVLHLSEDSLEFLESGKISGLLNKYCRFLPAEIYFEEKKINNPNPAWTRKPADLSDEDYSAFYRELYPMNFEDPLFHVHLNVDYPFNLTGILYFPKLRKSIEPQRDKIQLYSNQVFVTDSVENIVPEFLTLLKGVLDSPDIPLNVSRSYLQADGNVKKISSHITKKVADKLEELYKKDRLDFETKWPDIHLFIKYGIITDEKFAERSEKFNLFQTTAGKYFTKEELYAALGEVHKDKEGKTVVLYTTNTTDQHTYIRQAEQRGYSVLVMDGPFDAHFVNYLESKWSDYKFARVDADTLDKLIPKEDAHPCKLSEEEQKSLKEKIANQLDAARFNVVVESLSEQDQPMMITQPEFMRRMRDMQAYGGGAGIFGQMPETYQLVVNANHPLMSRILSASDSAEAEVLIRQTSDLAMLSQNLLKGEALSAFINRSLELI